ncbi:MAG TPA: hypothetical protein PKK76_12365 [Leptospiraceae bacterium]|nr:hypothetical protein [Leptospiraceae bacterium]
MRNLFNLAIAVLFTAAVGCTGTVGPASHGNGNMLTLFGVAALYHGGSPIPTNEWASTGSHASNAITASEGGYVELGRNVKLAVPAGALDQDEYITVTAIDRPAAADGVTPVLMGYKFEPEGLQFSKSALLTICYPSQELSSQGLSASTAQVYLQDEDGLIGMGGSESGGCVTASVDHFSTYLAGAQALVAGSSAPSVSATANFLPGTPVAGIPLRIRTIITSFQGTSTGSIAAAYVFWRTVGAPTYTQSVLTPDPTDAATPNRYTFLIPASAVTTTGIQYYFRAIDNLGKITTTPVRTRTIARTATGITLNPAATLNIASGFSRDYTLSVTSDVGGAQNISADTFNVGGGVGSAVKVSPSSIRFTAQGVGNGNLNVTAGSFSFSSPINVDPGQLVNVTILDQSSVAITGTLNLSVNQVYAFDAIGRDAWGNVIPVLPSFGVTGPIGTIGTSSGIFTASPTAGVSGTVDATLAGMTSSAQVTILSNAKALTAFSFPSLGATGVITGTNIAITVPAGTNVSALTASFTTTGVSVKVGSTVQTSGSTPNNFAAPVTYTVVAEDGSFQDYVVTLSNGPSVAANGMGPPNELQYCNLQFPNTMSVQTNQPTQNVYGRVYGQNVTEVAGPNPIVLADFGYGPLGSDPINQPGLWTFVTAVYNVQIANDDEYMKSIIAPAPGSYAYVFRFSMDGGAHYTYCDMDGAGYNPFPTNSFSPAQMGVMTVTP